MKSLAKILPCGLLASLLSGSLAACGVTSEVGTTHPNLSSPMGTALPVGAPSGDAAGNGDNPRAPRAAAPATAGPGRPAAAATVVAPAARPASPPAPPAAVASTSTNALNMRNMRTQSGRIIDEAGQPLVGATVLLKGTSRGASTDANGDYSLAVPLGVNTFVFGYSGYTSEVAQSRDGQPLTVTLLPAEDQPPAAAPEQDSKPHARKKRR